MPMAKTQFQPDGRSSSALRAALAMLPLGVMVFAFLGSSPLLKRYMPTDLTQILHI
jgi:hypothetical protein